MKKLKKVEINKKRLAILVGVGAVVISVGWFLSVGGLNKIKLAYKGYQIRSTYNEEYGNLVGSLTKFGLTDSKVEESQCTEEELHDQGVVMMCSANQNHYTVVGHEQSEKDAFKASAKQLDEQLALTGWKTHSNTAENFEEWVSEVVDGVDYNTDILASKKTRDGYCTMQLTVAYSNPAPPAVNLNANCQSPGFDIFID